MRAPLAVAMLTVVAFATAPLGWASTQASRPPGPQAPRAQAPTPPVLTDGFSLAVPAGWKVVQDPDVAAALERTDNPNVKAYVFVRREPKPADITDTLAKALANMKATGNTIVSNAFEVFLDRPALVAVVEDSTDRYRTVLVPREYEGRSQVFYAVTVTAPKAAYPKLTSTIARVFSSFTIVEDPTMKDVPRGFDRDAVIERMLSPLKKPGL